MFDLLDTLTNTVKPDYRSQAAREYRQSKPPAYYDRQCKVRKAKPGEYPAKELGPKQIPSVEALIAGAKINAHGQIHSCGWYLGDSRVTSYGESYFGDRGAKTLEDCMAKFRVAILGRRRGQAQQVNLAKEVAGYMPAKPAKFAIGKTYTSPESVEGVDSAKMRACLAKVGCAYVGCDTRSIPKDAELVLAWSNGSGWVKTNLTRKSFEYCPCGEPLELDVVKGATHYGVFNGKLGAWMMDKEGDCTKLWEGPEVPLGYDWVCTSATLFSFNGGRAPKQPTFNVKPSASSHVGAGVVVGPNWVVLPLNLENAKLDLT